VSLPPQATPLSCSSFHGPCSLPPSLPQNTGLVSPLSTRDHPSLPPALLSLLLSLEQVPSPLEKARCPCQVLRLLGRGGREGGRAGRKDRISSDELLRLLQYTSCTACASLPPSLPPFLPPGLPRHAPLAYSRVCALETS
jgi:hypothetical protein